MDEINLKFNEEARAKFVEKLSTEALKTFVESVKSAGDTGTFEVMITTENVDRMGEVIKLDGWDFSNYLKSPVVLWGHNYDEPPIGICTSLEKTNQGVKAIGKFAPTDFAQQIRKLYDMGMCRATSVGFIPTKQEGNVIMSAELLEFSFVSVPANPYALSLRETYKISRETAGMVMKGIMADPKFKKADAVGDPCTMDDGSEGTYADDGNGGMVCKIKEVEQKGAVADELSKEEVEQQKWEKINSVYDVFCAFIDVFMDEKTALADFSKLVSEMAGILNQVAGGTDVKNGKQLKLKFNDVKSIVLESTAKADEAPAGGSEDEGAQDDDEDIETDEKAEFAFRKKVQQSVAIIQEALGAIKVARKVGK